MATNGTLYTPQIPAAMFGNVDLNALGSQYAAQYGHNTTALLARVVHHIIYNAAPKQFYADLKILGLKAPEPCASDEFNFHEKLYGRDPVVITANAVGGVSVQTYTVTPASMDAVSVDTLIVFPNNQKGTVTAKNTAANQITVTAMTNQLLPAVTANDQLGNVSSVEGDGGNSISQYFRMSTVERTNYIQMFAKAMRFGKMELHKYKNSGTTNFLDTNRREMLDQHRIDIANAYWNGERGEVTLSNGAKAKTMGGIFPSMQAAGSYNVSTSAANIDAAVEDVVLATEYGSWGDTKFLYGDNKQLLALSKKYRSTLQRYNVGDSKAALYFEGIEMGSTKVLFVPMKRFADPASFPTVWAKRLILLDQESIVPQFALPEEMGSTLDRKNNGTLQNYVDEWISTTFSIKYNNPLGGGYVDIQ